MGEQHAADAGAFCCRCKEDFPVQDTPRGPRMGELRPLALYGDTIRTRFSDWLDHEDGAFLCGNCYFDLTDD